MLIIIHVMWQNLHKSATITGETAEYSKPASMDLAFDRASLGLPQGIKKDSLFIA